MKKRILSCLLAGAMGLFLLNGCSEIDSESTDKKQETAAEVSGDLKIDFLDVGQGDCTLLTCGGQTLLIDAGNNRWGEEVCSYLESKGITELDYVIGTHPDADHIGGMDDVLENFECGELLMPESEKDTVTYDEVVEAADEKGEEILHPDAGDTFSLGEAEVTVLGPERDDYENSNDSSIVVRVVHGSCSFLLAGDVEEEAEEDMMNSGEILQSDVYKVSHHGSRTGTTEEFLEKVDPEYAVISCGEGNSYGHPHAAVLNMLRSAGVRIFRTDDQGTITAKSDGKEITFGLSPSENWTPGEPGASSGEIEESEKGSSGKSASSEKAASGKSASEANAPQEKASDVSKEQSFVLNVNTGKFHLPDCASVGQMKEENKKTVEASKKEMVQRGYAPCANCIGK